MNIAIIGNNYFGPILAQQLNSFDKENNYKFYDTNQKKRDKVFFALNILNIDIVYSVSASVSGGGALNLALLFNKTIVQHFIGSDVLSAKEDYKNNKVNKKLIEKSTFLCVVKWLKEELNDIPLKTEVQYNMAMNFLNAPKKFMHFSVLTYIGKGKEKFYGIDEFILLAKTFEDVEFKIAGIENYPNLPCNIQCLGWVHMIDEMQNCTVFIRNAEHDGLGFTAIEALSLGRVVLWNYDFPYVTYFSSQKQLIEQFQNIKDQFDDGKLEVNKDAIAFVRKEFSKENVLSSLSQRLIRS